MERAVPRFSDHALNEILTAIREQLARSSCAEVVVLHPDRSRGSVPGRRLDGDGAPSIHRSLVAWCDLAEWLECRLAVSQPAGEGFVLLTFERLPVTQPWPPGPAEAESKYGAESGFQQLRKLEDPRFLLDYLEALERAAPPPGARVLSLGVNAGEELAAFGLLDPVLAAGLTFVGIDHAASALELARARWPDPRHRFIEADLASLDALELGRFELILALNVMQSPDLDDRALLRTLVQRSVSPGGALVLALPNSRYRGGELLYGTRTKNVRQPELSLLVKDIAFYRKYLQQHRFRVNVTGKYQLFVMAKRA